MKQYKLQKVGPVSAVSQVKLEAALCELDLGPMALGEEPVQLVVSLQPGRDASGEDGGEPAGLKAQYAAFVWLTQEELDEALAAGEQPVILGVRDV